MKPRYGASQGPREGLGSFHHPTFLETRQRRRSRHRIICQQDFQDHFTALAVRIHKAAAGTTRFIRSRPFRKTRWACPRVTVFAVGSSGKPTTHLEQMARSKPDILGFTCLRAASHIWAKVRKDDWWPFWTTASTASPTRCVHYVQGCVFAMLVPHGGRFEKKDSCVVGFLLGYV